MTTTSPTTRDLALIDPHPGSYLTEPQAQRIECFRACLYLVSGRSVSIDVVERITHWLYCGAES